MHKYDSVDALAVVLLGLGAALLAWGFTLEPPASLNELVSGHFDDWTPGLVIDGVLLLILNRLLRNHERKRVISQVASLSNEFALDAVRRCRDEGWLTSGTMAGRHFTKAKLAGADLSSARLARADLSFADLQGADLTHADLNGARLKGANLRGADLRWSDLRGTDLDWSDLRGAQLDGATLEGLKANFASVDKDLAGFPAFRHSVVGGFLSPWEIELVNQSFDALMKQGDSAIVMFYERLFQKAPQLRAAFSAGIERQAGKFLQSLKLIVSSLSSIERAAPVLQRLGERHRGYGVEEAHYALVGEVLIDTMSASLGPSFGDDAREAWGSAYRLIASIMSAGAH